MVTCVRPSLNNMLPMAPINPFVIGLKTTTAAAASATTTTTMVSTAAVVTTASQQSLTANSTMTTPTKPKLTFSIDAIVGGAAAGGKEEHANNNNNNNNNNQPHQNQQHNHHHHNHRQHQSSSAALSPLSNSQRSDSPSDDYERSPQHMLNCHQQPLELRNSFPVIYTRGAGGGNIGGINQTLLPLTPLTTPQRGLIYCRRRASLDRDCSPSRSKSPPVRCRSRSPTRSPHSPKSPALRRSPSPSSPLAKAAPILVPGLLPTGLVRPLPLQAPPPPLTASSTQPPATASSNLPPNGILPPPPQTAAGAPPHPLPPNHPPPPPPNPHLLAAQFQMAAALAHHHQQQQQQQQQQQHHHHPHPAVHLPPPHPMGMFPPGPHHPHFAGPHLIRDSYPLYPWLLSRHGRIFPHRFPGFLLQPFRKPKRVRTAFSPTQLLKLEHAFEGNHYVVGAERKQLAQGLSLTETQVKVWFQNRRTKHKRMQQEGGDSDSKSNKGDNDGKNDSSQHSYSDHEDDELDEHDDEGDIDDGDDDEDEVIDMDDYGSEIDAEEQRQMREHMREQASREFQQHHHHHQQQQQQQTTFLSSLQQQSPNIQQQHQQFMQHQLYLQQQHHQQQRQQHERLQQEQHQQQQQQQKTQP